MERCDIADCILGYDWEVRLRPGWALVSKGDSSNG